MINWVNDDIIGGNKYTIYLTCINKVRIINKYSRRIEVLQLILSEF